MYDPQLFEGLLSGAYSGIRSGEMICGSLWRECDGIMYRLDGELAGVNAFVAASGWYGDMCKESLEYF